MNKIFIVARREFLTRVQKKTFLLTTIGVPILIFAFYAVIIFMSVKSTSDFKVAVIDQANVFNGKIDEKKSSEVIFSFVDEDTATLNKKLEQKEYDAYLYVPVGFSISGQSNDSLQFRSAKTVGLMTREKIENRVSKALEEKRLLSMNISKAQLDSIQAQKELITFANTSGKKENQTKVGVSYAVGFISGFMIYIILFIYGTMVMRGVVEEKVSRIAEVIISSVKPFQLMMGKIIGIGAVGLIQFLIWGVLIIVIQLAVPVLFPQLFEGMQAQPVQPGMMAAVDATKQQPDMIRGLMEGLNQINFPLIVGCFVFYFLGGYFMYASLFAAVGSAANEDMQDAQSLLLPIMMPIIFGIVIMMQAVNNPNGNLAVFGSLFPLTSPIVMMARVAHGIPDGVSTFQLILSMLFLILGFFGTTWLAGKIYRTGILMYGKKVTWKELWKWAVKKN